MSESPHQRVVSHLPKADIEHQPSLISSKGHRDWPATKFLTKFQPEAVLYWLLTE